LFASITLPQFILSIITSSIVSVLVPSLAYKKDDIFHREIWVIIQIIGITFSIIAFSLSISAQLWLPLLLPGFDEKNILLTIILMRIQLIGAVLMGLNGILWSAYQAKERFISASLIPMLASLTNFIFLLFVMPRFGIIGAAWGFVVRSAIELVCYLPILGKYYYPDWKNSFLRQEWRLIRPMLLGNSIYGTNFLVDRFFLSMAPPGSLSLFYIAQQLYGSATQIINKAISGPIVPQLSRHAKKQRWSLFSRCYRKNMILIAWLTIGIIVGVIIAGGPLLKGLSNIKRLTESDMGILSVLMIALGGMFVGGAIGQILSSSFYSLGNTITPTRIGVFGYIVGVILKMIGFRLRGALGIAIATSIYYLINASMLYVSLEKRLRKNVV